MPLFIALTLLLLSMPILAADDPANPEDRWFDIELIVFARHPSQVEEVWPKDPGMPDLAATVTLPSREPAASAPRFPFQPLSAENERLQAALNQLETQADIEVLGHLAWRQAAIPQGLAPAVHIHLPTTPPEETGKTPTTDTSGAAPDMEARPTAAALTVVDTDDEAARFDGRETPVPGVDGRFRLSLNRYLHIDLDLLYDSAELADETAPLDDSTGSTPSPLEAPDGRALDESATPTDGPPETDRAGTARETSTTRYFRMRQSRRIKVGELQYFDHPYIGLLVLVERDEKPEDD